MRKVFGAGLLCVLVTVSAVAANQAQGQGQAAGQPQGQAAGQPQGPRRPTAPPVPQGATDIWTIDSSHTSAHFTVRHMLVSTVPGQLGPVAGWVRYDGKNPSSLAVNVAIDVTGINTQNAGRDRHLRTDDFFLVEQFPDITFVSKRVEGVSNGRFKLVGDLTIRGVTKEVALDVDGPHGPVVRAANQAPIVGASATTTINRKDYGVKYGALIEAGGAVVSDEVKITINIEARKGQGR
ncbi:MAG: YceI family protein [Acidobacteriota bacterium]|nr:YceI family protein [Acidobacteriota bacterium]